MASPLARGLRDGAVSALCFLAVLVALVSIDPRVRERVGLLLDSAPEDAAGRMADLLKTLMSAAADQSLAHAPLVIFAVVGVLLVLAMLRS